MSAFERVVGNIISSILIFLVFLSILYMFLNLSLGEIKNIGLYGNRGESYIAE